MRCLIHVDKFRYARSLENGKSVPSRPAVVVAASGAGYIVQTFENVQRISDSGMPLSVGDVVSL
jgi:hypothetical protein